MSFGIFRTDHLSSRWSNSHSHILVSRVFHETFGCRSGYALHEAYLWLGFVFFPVGSDHEATTDRMYQMPHRPKLAS